MRNSFRLATILTTVLAALASTSPAYLQGQDACVPPPSGLAGWWAGDGNAADMLGQHNGLIEGGLTFTPAKVADGFNFNGVDAAIQFGSAGDFAKSDFTLDFWLNSRSSANEEGVIEKRAFCSHGPFYGIRMDYAEPGHLVVETDDGQGNYVAITTKKAVNDATFHLIALVRQGRTTSAYIDGTLDSASTTAAVANVSNSAPLTAGKSVCDGRDGTVPFGGVLDEIQVFFRALSTSEIQAIYKACRAGECKDVMLSPTSLAFAADFPQLVGVRSPFRSVTLTNHGTAELTISKITSSCGFPHLSKCGSSLAAGASCTIPVAFKPEHSGKRGTLSVTDNAPGSPHLIPLVGNATFVLVSATSLSFAAQTVGTTSAPQAITLTNTASTALTISGIQIAGKNPHDFVQSDACGTTLAPGASCTITVTFNPTTTGIRTGSLEIGDDGGSSPQMVRLTGNGTL